MPSVFRRTLLCLCWWPLLASAQDAFPDRESFVAHPRKVEQVPMDAFMFGEEFADDLKMEVWAQSPMIYSPVAMDVDAQGRLWVTEGIDYNVNKRIATGQSIMVLSDTDHDGKADESHIFVTDQDVRHAPLGIAVFDNRIVLSSTPDLIIYTDVDRNAVFDPNVDKREVFLTGFKNTRHDHTLHAVVGSPTGEWYFSYGNCGADIHTRDGRQFLSGCYYGFPEAIGKPSSDGHVYVGGVAMRIQPDGTGLHPVGHNLRNTHDMFVTSLGDVLQSDNDDPAHCRSTWLMEHGNMGYADLRDGSRSWEEVSKSWDEPQGWHRDLRFSRSHWRENYPGALPPGSVYGAGSPTGNVFIEGDELGKNNRGVYLVCDMMRKEVMACRPTAKDAQIEMGKHRPFLTLKSDSKGENFLPTDVVIGPDGALYVSDFFNDTSRRTNQLSGTIYRITHRDSKASKPPVIDFESNEGLLTALKNPAVNVRAEAVRRLMKSGGVNLAKLKAFFENEQNPYLRMRSLWILAHLNQAYVRQSLESEDESERLVAFRALRRADPRCVLGMVNTLHRDPAPSIRREVAIALRDYPLESCEAVLPDLIKGYDGKNRWYLEALGIAATKKEGPIYKKWVRPGLNEVPYGDWDMRAKNLAWRFHTPEAIEDIFAVILAQKPSLEEFRHLAMAFASFRSDAERRDRAAKLSELSTLKGFADEGYRITIDEILRRDLNDLKGEYVRSSIIVPTSFGIETTLSDIEVIATLEGDAVRGKVKTQACLACHKVQGVGVVFGPDLSHWGSTRTIPEILKEIIDPSAKLAHGYDKPVRLIKGEHVMEGQLSNFSWHAGSLKLKVYGGQTKKILFRKSGAKVERLENHSWMPPASSMGLTDQDVRDVAEYLKTLGGS